MKIVTQNNWLLVKPVEVQEEKKETSTILLPEDFRRKSNPYTLVKVLHDANGEYANEDVVVPTHMITEVNLGSDSFFVVEKNHVLAIIE